jgi:peroxiredoxin
MARLNAGDPFPQLTVSTVDGRSITLPADLEGSDAILLFYRADPLEKARQTVEEDKLPYPVAYGLRVPEDADRIGAWWDSKRRIIQPAEFLLGPDRKVLHATYSTCPIGRIAAEDALSLLRFLKAKRS